MAPADVGLGVGLGLGLFLALAQFVFVQPRLQHGEGLGAVLVLRAVVLTLHDDVGRQVGDADGAVGLVDVLPPRARRPVGVDAQVLVLDHDLDGVVDHRVDPGRGKTGVAAGTGIIGRNADQAVHAAFRLEPAIGVMAGNLQRRRLDTGFFAGAFFQPFDLVAMGLGPARIHAQQHFGPILGLGAAGPGVNFKVCVVGVGLAGQERFQLRRVGADLQRRQRRFGLGDDGVVALGLAHFDQLDAVGQFTLDRVDVLDPGFQAVALAHQGLGFFRVVPQFGIFRLGVQFLEFKNGIVVVKDASSAVPMTARCPERCW